MHEGKPNFAHTDIRESVKRVKVLQLKKIEIEIEKCLIGAHVLYTYAPI